MPPQKTVVALNGNLSTEGKPTVIEQSKMSIATPIYNKNGESFAMSLGGGRILFNESQVFDNGEKTPKSLERVDLGVQYSTTLKKRAFWGLRGSLGSASDQPFRTKEEVTFSLSTFYTKPGDGRGQWIYTVFLSNNNSLANYIPIPGFIYLYRNQGFTGMFGLPFLSIQWTPKAPWLFSMSYFITNFNNEIAYGLRDKFQTFLGFAISQQNFLRADREERTDRLFFNEKKIFLGTRSPLTNEISGEFQTGLSFDRKLKEGKRFNDIDLEADMGRSWYLSFNLNFAI